MCGIAGFYGHQVCEDILINFLEKLEYRGYDSSGIAVKNKNNINLVKGTYKINELKEVVKTKTTNSCGIAHTRWATHGKANKDNSHPHYSANKVWFAVHNGIIENYASLKNKLINCNIKFSSETDSEVIPQLLEYNNVKNIYEFIDTINMLKGAYAICAFNNFDNSLYLAKYKNPLYIAEFNNEFFIASDPICFNEITTKYYTLNDNEFCIVSDNKLCFYNNKHKKINKKQNVLNSKYLKCSKENYSTFMEKEINEIPKVLKNILTEYKKNNYFEHITSDFLDVKRVVIIGCGTAYHSGLIGAKYLESVLNIPISVELASEFLCGNPIINNSTSYIFVSQSGETADTINALNLVKNKCKNTIAITNVTYSTIAQNVDIVLPVFAGPEIAVASTKAYNAQLLVFYLFSEYLKNFKLETKFFNKIKREIKKINIATFYHFDKLTKIISNFDSLFILGKFKDYFTALEASLKIREITYSNCSALPCGELKHGTLALVSNKTTCIIISTNRLLHSKTISAINEIKARLGKIVLVTNSVESFKDCSLIDYLIELPNVDENLIDLVSVIPFQLFALQLSLTKKINPDKPRNLAKSVTVE